MTKPIQKALAGVVTLLSVTALAVQDAEGAWGRRRGRCCNTYYTSYNPCCDHGYYNNCGYGYTGYSGYTQGCGCNYGHAGGYGGYAVAPGTPYVQGAPGQMQGGQSNQTGANQYSENVPEAPSNETRFTPVTTPVDSRDRNDNQSRDNDSDRSDENRNDDSSRDAT